MKPWTIFRLASAVAALCTLWGDDPAGGGNGNPPTPPPAAREPETFSKDYVRELREENKGWRLKASEQEAAARTATAAAAAAEAAATAKITETNTAADQRVIRAELKASALKAGMVDLDGLKLLDLSTVKLNAQGEVEGADALMDAAKKAKPYLFGAASTSSGTKPPNPNPPTTKKAQDMTPEEYNAAKAALLRA
jgi:hypothetical protein